MPIFIWRRGVWPTAGQTPCNSLRLGKGALRAVPTIFIPDTDYGGHAAGRVRVRRLCPPYGSHVRRQSHAEAAEAREFDCRAAQVDAEYCAEEVDLKTFDPAGGHAEIAVERD